MSRTNTKATFTVIFLSAAIFCQGPHAYAEVRKVSIGEVMEEFCAVVVANEDHYTKLIESCFPNSAQDADTRNSCRAVVNSITKVMNEFYRIRESDEVVGHYFVSNWKPSADIVKRWNCKNTISRWSCPGVTNKDVLIASQEPICADALDAEDRIVGLLGNARRADRLLTVKSLRVTTEEIESVVPPEWSID